MIRTFKYRIYPTKQQAETLEQHLAICCEMYNAALQERREAWKLERKSVSLYDQINQIPAIRVERPDVAGVYAQSLEEPLQRVNKAFMAFFRRVKKGQSPGYPRFRSVRRYDSLVFRQRAIKAPEGNKLCVRKVGQVKIRQHRPLEGPIKTLTIKREAGRWLALFVCEVEPRPLPFNPNSIGVDVGLSAFATLSDGTVIDNPRWYKNGQRALRVAQRRVARRKKGSNRRRKAIVLLQRAHIYLRQQRIDFQHKLSRTLVDRNGLIVVEDLNVKGLASGMLAKSVHDAGWSQFINMLSYKAESAGRLLVKVDPRGTSQTCICGATVRKTLSMREHVCVACGLVADRDHVSAQVILSRAEAQPLGANVDALMSCVA